VIDISRVSADPYSSHNIDISLKTLLESQYRDFLEAVLSKYKLIVKFFNLERNGGSTSQPIPEESSQLGGSISVERVGRVHQTGKDKTADSSICRRGLSSAESKICGEEEDENTAAQYSD